MGKNVDLLNLLSTVVLKDEEIPVMFGIKHCGK